MRSPRILSLLLAALTLGFVAAPAFAQAGPVEVRVRETGLDPDGTTRIVVGTAGTQGVLGAQAFAVTEDGQVVSDLKVEPLLESKSQPVSVVLVMDVSGSIAGAGLANAKTAAKAFVDGVVPRGVQVEIVAFSDRASVRAGFTTDRAALARTIDALEAGGETAMYDGVVLASQELSRRQGQRNLLVLSDGKDTASSAKLADAIAAAQRAQTQVNSVALVTPDLDQAALDDMARRTGGKSTAVSSAGALASAFQNVAEQLASQYVLSYRGTNTEHKELNLAVAITAAGSRAQDQVVVVNPRSANPVTALPPASAAKPALGLFASPAGLYAGIGAAFLAVVLLLASLASIPVKSEAGKVLSTGLRFYTRGGVDARKASSTTSNVTRQAADLLERIPKPAGWDERLQAQLERAGWPMRASEFLLLMVGSGVGVGVLASMLSGRWLGLPLFGIVGAFIPKIILSQRVDARTSAFLDQLPDTLQLLAGSLRAGYGLLQSVDTVVQEAPEPTAGEFARVLTEARLGMPLEDAFEGMAERVGSEDFRWVVLAINIQRQVGGNLAALLDTVASTLREREQVRRQIKVLSAEGKLSAVVLVGLPIFLAGYMFLVNPAYIGLLFTNLIGLVMVGGASALMAVGVLWMRKLIKIEV